MFTLCLSVGVGTQKQSDKAQVSQTTGSSILVFTTSGEFANSFIEHCQSWKGFQRPIPFNCLIIQRGKSKVSGTPFLVQRRALTRGRTAGSTISPASDLREFSSSLGFVLPVCNTGQESLRHPAQRAVLVQSCISKEAFLQGGGSFLCETLVFKTSSSGFPNPASSPGRPALPWRPRAPRSSLLFRTPPPSPSLLRFL